MVSPVITPIAKIFAINDDLALRALDGLTDAQLWSAPTLRNNPMMWVVGHFVQTRAQLLALLGEPIDTGWQERFMRGATLRDATQYPSRDEVERIMNEVTRRLHGKLANIDDEQVDRPPAVALPGANTVADEIALFAFHDSYHVGQMAFIRKALGYPALAG